MVVFSRKYSSLVMKIQGEFKLVLVEKSSNTCGGCKKC